VNAGKDALTVLEVVEAREGLRGYEIAEELLGGVVGGDTGWDDAAGLRPLFLEKRGDGGRAALQGGAVFLREGVHLLAFDVDGAHDLPPCAIRDRDDDL
jgi:hypothetical protein